MLALVRDYRRREKVQGRLDPAASKMAYRWWSRRFGLLPPAKARRHNVTMALRPGEHFEFGENSNYDTGGSR